MPDQVYLDYQSTTPCDPRVVEAMVPYFSTHFANAGSLVHQSGRAVAKVVDEARATMASLLGAEARDLIFTASATEANNLALKGLAVDVKQARNEMVVCGIDHASVLNPARFLQQQGFKVHFLNVDAQGKIELSKLNTVLNDKTLLVSICHGNSEIGTLQNLKTISAHCREHGAFFHVDASQSILTEKVDVQNLEIDLLSMSAHKIYGPKGIGLLYRRRKQPRVRLTSLLHGGEQEWGLRSGTLNVPGIVGMAKACELVAQNRDEERASLKKKRDRLRDQLQIAFPDAWINGGGAESLVQNLNMGFPHLNVQDLLCDMPKVMCSKGSSCSLDIRRPSHVLLGIGLSAEKADACMRLSVGRFTTDEDIEFSIDEISKAVKLKRQSLTEVSS